MKKFSDKVKNNNCVDALFAVESIFISAIIITEQKAE